MVSRPDTKKARAKRHKRVRSKISGTASCPRLCVFRSTSNIYAQIIDDVPVLHLLRLQALIRKSQAMAETKRQLRLSASSLLSVQKKRISLMLYSTEAVTYITAVLRNWPKAPVRAASISKDWRNNFG